MSRLTELQQKDRQFIWHPFTQMQTAPPAIVAVQARGALIIDENGNEYIDVNASWWVTVHGHSHPYIAQAIARQASQMEHIIFAGFTHPKAIELSERLLQKLPFVHKLFFSDNGSTAVEVALKMALQYWYNQDVPKTKIIALEGAYHGDTFGAMSVTARTAFNAPFDKHLFQVEFIPFPHPGKEDKTLQALTGKVAQGDVAAFIVEPLIQGASGMRMYAARVLDQLFAVAKKHRVICIADEVMTGFGRTGKWFASDYLTEKPDIIALSKGITGGFMPLGATLCTNTIYDAFISGNVYKTFFHGHSYTANPLACAAACASFDLLDNPETQQNIQHIARRHRRFAEKIKSHQAAKAVRTQGTVLAVEVNNGNVTSYFNELNKHVSEFFLQRGILIRPLGNVIYLIPPYCITNEQLDTVYRAMVEFLDEVLR